MNIHRIERVKELIKILQQDINDFGPSGDDIARLNAYKKELKELKEGH